MSDFKTGTHNVLVENAFYIWLNTLILLLCITPSITKTWELKIYFVTTIAAMLITYLVSNFKNIASVFRYRFYAIGVYPLIILIYITIQNIFIRDLVIFGFSALGLGIQCYDIYKPSKLPDSLVTHSHRALLVSIVLSILLITYNSSENTFSIVSGLALFVFLAFFIILRFVNIPTKYGLWAVPIFLFIITFLSMDNKILDVAHYAFFLGPAVEMIYGHSYHPFLLDIQYGGGLTQFLVLYFKLIGGVSFQGLQILLRVLTFIQYILVYFIACRIYQSHKVAFLTMLVILVFNFFYMTDWYYYFPSMGFLRFGFIYIILVCYLLEDKLISKNASLIIICLISSIATIWSLESAVYTLPAIIFAEYINKNLSRFLVVFSSCFLIVIIVYFFPFIMKGEWPLLSKYYEYAMIYANGYVQLPLIRKVSFWWLFPLLYVFILINIITGRIKNKVIIGLTIYGLAVFTYFGGRSHPNNLYTISIPFILLSIYLIINTQKGFIKQVLLSGALSIFFMANQALTTTDAITTTIKNINIPRVMNSFTSIDNFKKSINLNTAFLFNGNINCSVYLPLEKYIEDDSLAIIYNDYTSGIFNMFNAYACTKTHNAFQINTYLEFVLNPYAVQRKMPHINEIPNKYILIDENLDNKKHRKANAEISGIDPKIPDLIIEKLHTHTRMVGSINVNGTNLIIYRNLKPKL